MDDRIEYLKKIRNGIASQLADKRLAHQRPVPPLDKREEIREKRREVVIKRILNNSSRRKDDRQAINTHSTRESSEDILSVHDRPEKR